MRYLEGQKASLESTDAKLWAAYEAEERAARGLRPDQALDSIRAVPLPLEKAITHGTNGYVLALESSDKQIAALPLDEWALSQDGSNGVVLTGHKAEADLDPRLKPTVEVATGADAEASAGGK